MQIRSVLSTKDRPIISINTDMSVSDAVAELVKHNIGSLPVRDSSGSLVGIFTERDVLRGLQQRGKEFCHESIGSVMTGHVVTCTINDSVHEAMGRMSEFGIGQLPVLDDEGELVGLVSVGDLIRVLHASAEEEKQNLMNYVYGGV